MSEKFDFKTIKWGTTILTNILRAAISGLILGVIFLIIIKGQNILHPLPIFLLPFGLSLFNIVFCFVIGLPLTIIILFIKNIFGENTPWFVTLPFEIMLFMTSILLILADPFMFILGKINPKIVGTSEYKFIKFSPIIWIIKNI